MNLATIVALLQAAGANFTGAAAQQFIQWATAFVQALPAIEQGIASAEPFVAAAVKLIQNGGAPIADADWAAQLALLQAQVDMVGNQVAADEQAQPAA